VPNQSQAEKSPKYSTRVKPSVRSRLLPAPFPRRSHTRQHLWRGSTPLALIASRYPDRPYPHRQLQLLRYKGSTSPFNACLGRDFPYRTFAFLPAFLRYILFRLTVSSSPSGFPSSFRGSGWEVFIAGHEVRWRRRGRTNRHPEVSSDRSRNHHRMPVEAQSAVGCCSRPKTRELRPMPIPPPSLIITWIDRGGRSSVG
jgi:hypothetical protein